MNRTGETCKMNKKETVTIIRSLLSSTNASCGIYTLNKEFRDETGIDIPLFGYSSLSEFLESIPDTVKLTGLYPIQKVSLVKNDASAHIVSLVKRQRRDKKSKKGMCLNNAGYLSKNSRDHKCCTMNDKILDTRQNRLPKLVHSKVPPQINSSYHSSIKVDIISDEKSNTKENKTLDCDEVRLPSPTNYIRRMIQKCSSESDQTSSSKEKELPNPNQAPAVNIGPNLLLQSFDCFVKSDEKIPANDLKLHAKVGHYVEVYPCEISHPGLFYLNFRELKKKLSKFMDELQEFYLKHEEIPKLSETPKPEQVCAVCYSRHGDDARWYRAQVEEILSDCLVVVRLVDYGTTTKILVKNLKHLHRNFISFPRQAVLGSLANIKPSGGCSEWSKSAIKKFHELAFCRDLVGGVVSINCDACSLSVALSSTVGEEVHVNDTLVEEGLAEFDVEVRNEGEKWKSKITEDKERSAGSVKETDFPSPVFYSKQSHKNSRLQKMFTVRE